MDDLASGRDFAQLVPEVGLDITGIPKGPLGVDAVRRLVCVVVVMSSLLQQFGHHLLVGHVGSFGSWVVWYVSAPTTRSVTGTITVAPTSDDKRSDGGTQHNC